jgi:hypothetical protein
MRNCAKLGPVFLGTDLMFVGMGAYVTLYLPITFQLPRLIRSEIGALGVFISHSPRRSGLLTDAIFFFVVPTHGAATVTNPRIFDVNFTHSARVGATLNAPFMLFIRDFPHLPYYAYI